MAISFARQLLRSKSDKSIDMPNSPAFTTGEFSFKTIGDGVHAVSEKVDAVINAALL